MELATIRSDNCATSMVLFQVGPKAHLEWQDMISWLIAVEISEIIAIGAIVVEWDGLLRCLPGSDLTFSLFAWTLGYAVKCIVRLA